MPRHRTRLALPVAAVALAAALAPALVADPVPARAASAGRGSPAGADRATSAAFTAEVASIVHGLRTVRVTGTAPVGASVAVSGPDVETVWAEGTEQGTWEAEVRVPRGRTVLVAELQTTGARIDLPVAIDDLSLPPTGKLDTDSLSRTTHVRITPAKPGARWEFTVDGEEVGTAVAGADGIVEYDFERLGFGNHLFVGLQYYDGARNGLWFGEQVIDGTPRIEAATASRETERILLAGRAPLGTTLRFATQDGPVTDDRGHPVEVPVANDTTWRAELPLSAALRGAARVTVTTHDGDEPVGTSEAEVTVPAALTATAEELADGSVRLAGSGQAGGTVELEDVDGLPVRDDDGRPVATTIERSWQLVLSRRQLPGEVVVVRQRVDGVEQGSLRLVLPRVPGTGSGSGSAGTGPGGVVVPEGPSPRTAAEQLRHRAAAPGRLASTGTDLTAPATAAAALLAAGFGGLVVARRGRRRRTGRD